MDILPAIELETKPDVTASVIWLHGLGADGHDFEPIVPELKLPGEMAVRFILPHAPTISVTINGGAPMPGWFDILEHGGRINVAQLLASAAAVHKLIDREVERGVASEQILLVGFSQGGSVSLQAGLTYDHPLAGILGLSTFFPSADAISPHPANHTLPIHLYHGTEDPVIPLQMAATMVRHLQRLGYHPEYRTYPMPHSVCLPEIADISQVIQDILL